ncbi:MAG: hypothetical protein KBA46_08290 [Candidatus Omnitrophica bacterium]|nr:hypothetical protein [Candidatus Omnitrophota bacterium]
MKKTLLILLFSALFCYRAFGLSPEETRKIESEKRTSLSNTEIISAPASVSPANSPDDQRDAFLSGLFSKEYVTIDDALQTISLLLNQSKDVFQEDVLPPALKKSADMNAPLRKGTAAFMFYKALNIKGGIWLKSFGTTERYALRELVFKDIMLAGYTQDYVSGKELLYTLTRSAEYLSERLQREHSPKSK